MSIYCGIYADSWEARSNYSSIDGYRTMRYFGMACGHAKCMLGTAGESQAVWIASLAMQALQVHRTRAAARLIQRQSWSWVHRRISINKRRSNCRGPGAHTIILLESTEFVLVQRQPPLCMPNQCPVSPLPISHNPTTCPPSLQRRPVVDCSHSAGAEGYFREGVPSSFCYPSSLW